MSFKEELIERSREPWAKEYEKAAKQERETFINKFNPQKLSQQDGLSLLRFLFYNDLYFKNPENGISAASERSKNSTSHWVRDFSSDQAQWILYYGKRKGSEKAGWFYNSKLINEPEAILKGREIQSNILTICDYINSTSLTNPTQIDYSKLQTFFDKFFPLKKRTLRQTWLKYFCLNYPDLIPPLFQIDRIRKILDGLEISFDNNDSHFELIGKRARCCSNYKIYPAVFGAIAWGMTNDKKLEKPVSEISNDVDVNGIRKNICDDIVAGDCLDTLVEAKDPLNVIFYGVPGCGKSYYISHILLDEAEKEKDGKDCSNVFRVTFYPEYSYTDFVGQIQPKLKDGKLVYGFVPGPFTKALKSALEHPDTKTFLIIEEINRGNAAAIFGDLFQLLDRNKEGNSEYPITNLEIADYIGVESGKVSLPKNLYLFATRNTSDQNVSALDTAFKRRWEWQHISNKPAEDFKDKYLPEIRMDGELVSWNSFVEARNKQICEVNSCNSSDKQLGYYFVRDCDLISKEEKDTETEVKKAKFFWEKVFRYLWNDAFAMDHTKGFNKKLHSLSDVLDLLQGKAVEAKDILSENVEIVDTSNTETNPENKKV